MYFILDLPQYRRSDIENLSINNNDGRIEILAVEVHGAQSDVGNREG